MAVNAAPGPTATEPTTIHAASASTCDTLRANHREPRRQHPTPTAKSHWKRLAVCHRSASVGAIPYDAGRKKARASSSDVNLERADRWMDDATRKAPIYAAWTVRKPDCECTVGGRKRRCMLPAMKSMIGANCRSPVILGSCMATTATEGMIHPMKSPKTVASACACVILPPFCLSKLPERTWYTQ